MLLSAACTPAGDAGDPPPPTAEATPISSADSPAGAAAAPTPTSSATDAPAPTAAPSAGEPDEVATPEPAVTPDATPGPAVEEPPTVAVPSGRNVVVALSDGRVFEAPIECTVADTAATGWSFAFEGFTSDGVEIEGAYDSADPGFATLFLVGPDALSGSDLFLTNDEGGDDFVETTTGGTTWQAVVSLSDDVGGEVTARLAASCN